MKAATVGDAVRLAHRRARDRRSSPTRAWRRGLPQPGGRPARSRRRSRPRFRSMRTEGAWLARRGADLACRHVRLGDGCRVGRRSRLGGEAAARGARERFMTTIHRRRREMQPMYAIGLAATSRVSDWRVSRRKNRRRPGRKMARSAQDGLRRPRRA